MSPTYKKLVVRADSNLGRSARHRPERDALTDRASGSLTYVSIMLLNYTQVNYWYLRKDYYTVCFTRILFSKLLIPV